MAAFVENGLRAPPSIPPLAKGGRQNRGDFSFWKKAGGRHSKRLLPAVALGLLLLIQPTFETVARTPTPAELNYLSEQAKSAFVEFLQLWQEERYFEMYEHGKRQSRAQLTMEEYATRMVELDWVPVGLSADKASGISFRYRTMIYMNADIIFRHKSYYDLQFNKQKSFLLLKEDGSWRFDLIQMIRSPFYSPSDS